MDAVDDVRHDSISGVAVIERRILGGSGAILVGSRRSFARETEDIASIAFESLKIESSNPLVVARPPAADLPIPLNAKEKRKNAGGESAHKRTLSGMHHEPESRLSAKLAAGTVRGRVTDPRAADHCQAEFGLERSFDEARRIAKNPSAKSVFIGKAHLAESDVCL
ncbi:hypothetical protein PQQ72_24045 [Paraburkholderia strydomiana]|uniref:hypothetical protein n=1 Tax=Paraburkholderia strydomiana TaxID=1245417 RepID=UPI0038B6EC9B